MRRFIRALPSACVLSACCLSSARADEVYGNSTLARPDGGLAAVANFGSQRIQAINFNTGSSSLLGIDQGWVLLRKGGTGASIDLTVELFADSSSLPGGTALGSTTLTVTSGGTAPASWRNFSFSSTVTLEANRDYWLVMSYPSTVSVNWMAPDSTTTTYSAFNASGYSVPSTSLRANSTDGSTWSTGTPAEMGFQLSAVAVPEPSTEALAAAGLGIAGLSLRFKRRG